MDEEHIFCQQGFDDVWRFGVSDWQQTAYNKQIQWLTTMANNPGFSDHAWHMARLMDKAPSGIFKGIAQDLEACMKKLSDGQAKAGV